jgi:hypothetical protein
LGVVNYSSVSAIYPSTIGEEAMKHAWKDENTESFSAAPAGPW